MTKSEEINQLQQDFIIIFEKNLNFSQKLDEIKEKVTNADDKLQKYFWDFFHDKDLFLKEKLDIFAFLLSNLRKLEAENEEKIYHILYFNNQQKEEISKLQDQLDLQFVSLQEIIWSKSAIKEKLDKKIQAEKIIQEEIENLKKSRISKIDKILNFLTCGLYDKKRKINKKRKNEEEKLEKVLKQKSILLDEFKDMENEIKDSKSIINTQKQNINFQQYILNLNLVQIKILELKNNYQQEIIKSNVLIQKMDWTEISKLLANSLKEISNIFKEKPENFQSELNNFWKKIKKYQSLFKESKKDCRLGKKVISELENDLQEEITKINLKIENLTSSLINITNINNQPIQVSSQSTFKQSHNL